MKNGQIEYATKDDVLKIAKEVKAQTEAVAALADNVNIFVVYLNTHLTTMTSMAQGKVPQDCVPIKTHNVVIKGLIWCFCVTLVAAVSAVKVIPVWLDKM